MGEAEIFIIPILGERKFGILGGKQMFFQFRWEGNVKFLHFSGGGRKLSVRTSVSE